MTLDFRKIDWPQLLPKLGVDPKYLTKMHTACPIENDGKDRFRFINEKGTGSFYCNNCGGGNGLQFLRLLLNKTVFEVFDYLKTIDVPLIDEDAAAVHLKPIEDDAVIQKKKADKLNKVWDESQSIMGTPVQTYLEKRVERLDINVVSKYIRYHPEMPFYDKDEPDKEKQYKGNFPCMLAKVIDLDGQSVTLHRTYLTKEGDKAPFAKVKLLMPSHKKLNGAAIRLCDNSSDTLVVCEGIEKGYALALLTEHKFDVWSVITAGNLSKAKIPKKYKRVIIAADRDPLTKKTRFREPYRPGEYFADLLKVRLEQEGFHVVVKVPKVEKFDWNDVWNQMCDLKVA